MNRSIPLYIGVVLIVLVFTARLFYIQVMDEQYKAKSDRNATGEEKLYAPRGYIYDRNGKILVGNEVAYDLLVSPYLIEDLDTTALGNLLGMDNAAVKKQLTKAKKYSYFRQSIFLELIPKETFAQIKHHLYRYPFLSVQKRILRNYPHQNAANVVGFIGEVNTEFIRANPWYSMGDLVGKSGIDKSYEEALRGEKGYKLYVVDHRNRRQGSYKNGSQDQMPVPGQDITSSIDLALQQYGELLMSGKRGSIIAIEPSTGEILAMVTSPTYDPNDLVGQVRSRNYTRMYYDSLNKPLYDRAILAEYPPGSPFKLINALVGLQEGVISPRTTMRCVDGFHYRSLHVACHCNGGTMALRESISESCNNYYCNVFKRIIEKYPDAHLGMDTWSNHVKSFGLGRFLGNDLPTGKKGLVPNAAYYNRFLGYTGWRAVTMISNGIGQGELVATPIQLANMTAAIANRGHYYTPHIVKAIDGQAITDTNFIYPKYTTIDSVHFEPVIRGMYDVFETGTAKASKLEHISQCGKTGTAENPHGQDHSIFVSFAPMEAPKIAIAVVIENGYWGSRWAAPISSLMTEYYLTDTITRPALEARMINGDLHNEYRSQHVEIYGTDSTYNPNF